jgi:uncharacterized protein YecT (DUF1311 family)
MESIKEKLREMIASQVHVSWSGWIHYQLCTKGIKNEDGSITITKEDVDCWAKQMNTAYNQLPEEEKKSDRQEANFYIAVIEAWLMSISESEKQKE